MVSRMRGKSFVEMQTVVSELELEIRELRWTARLILYDAYFGEPDFLDHQEIGSYDSTALMVLSTSFRVLWEMDCRGEFE